MSRLLSTLTLLALLLLAAAPASAVMVRGEKTAVPDFFGSSLESASGDEWPATQYSTRGGVDCSYEPALDVRDGPNLYAYCEQNPWSRWDPLGLDWKSETHNKDGTMKTKEAPKNATKEQQESSAKHNAQAAKHNAEVERLRSTPAGAKLLDELGKSKTEFEVKFTDSKDGKDQTARADGSIVYNPEVGFTVLAHEGYHAYQRDKKMAAVQAGKPLPHEAEVQLVPGVSQPTDAPDMKTEHAATRFQNVVTAQFLIQKGVNGSHPTPAEVMNIKGPTEHGLRTYDQVVRDGRMLRMQQLPIRRSYDGSVTNQFSMPLADPSNYQQ